MEIPRNGVSSKCAATSLTFHLGETVCFSQSSGARERRSSISIPSSFGKRCAVRIGGKSFGLVFKDGSGTKGILTLGSPKSNPRRKKQDSLPGPPLGGLGKRLATFCAWRCLGKWGLQHELRDLNELRSSAV